MSEHDIDQAVRQARRHRLELALKGLADWANNRASGGHDVETTLALLERKAAKIREQVLSAGHRAAAACEQQTKEPNERIT